MTTLIEASPVGIPRFDLLIFDCDGVLIDSERIAAELDARELTAHGIPISTAVLAERFTGVTYADMYRVLETETGVRLPHGFAKRTHELVLDACIADQSLAVPGVAAALDALPLPRCVASSSSPDWLRRTLEAVKLFGRFAPHIFSAAEVARGKPAPDLFLHAACRMKAEPDSCVVIEDSVAGVTAAVAAGMTPVGFVGTSLDPIRLAVCLRNSGATAIFDHMAQLPDVLTGLGSG